MNKKILLAALLAVSTGATLASCGSGTASDTTPTAADASFTNVSAQINVWAPSEEEAVIKQIVDEYNGRQTEATSKFNYKFTSVSEADGGTTLAKDPTVANYPSLVAAADDQINSLASKKIINPLSGKMLERAKQYSTEFSIKCVTVGADVYGFPIEAGNGYFMYYDTTLVGNTDLTDFAAILKHAKDTGKKIGINFNNGWYASMFFFADNVCGTTSLQWKRDSDNKLYYDVTWDNQKGVAAATAMNTLVQPYVDDGTLVADADDTKIKAGFHDGTYMAAISGLWNKAGIEAESAKGAGDGNTHMSAVELPKIKVGETVSHLGSFSGSKLYVVNAFAKTEEQRAAFYLGDLLTRKDSQLLRFKVRSSIPCNIAALADKEYTDNVNYAIKALQAQQSYAAIQSQSAVSNDYWDRGAEIGKAISNGDLGSDTNGTAYTWATFMKAKCDMMRVHK